MRKLKKGDDVIVIAGKDKGTRSTISKVISEEKVLIDNVNLVKKHQKGNPNTGTAGGIISKEMPIHISNVAIYNAETKKADRVGISIDESGNKYRVFKSDNRRVDA